MFIALGLGLGLAVWAAVAMTFGDWLWAALSLRHRAPYGLAHGTLLCLWMGLYIGAVAGPAGVRGSAEHEPARNGPAGLKPRLYTVGVDRGALARGALGGALVGLAAAATFYALAPAFGYYAMFASWVLLWCGLTALPAWAAGGPFPWRSWALRALGAAVVSGAAFYAVAGIWMRPPQPPNYLWNFGAWTFAFLPGALATLAGWRRPRVPS